MGLEFELKYRLTPQALEAIRDRLGPARELEMETAYYDTPEGELSRRRWTLRRRYENRRSVCALKTPADGFARQEWETEAADIRQGVEMLCKLGCPEELAALASGGLVEVCGARFRRLAWTLEGEGATLELALDRGVLTGGGRQVPLLELEVELKEGSREGAVAFARRLAEEFGLVTEGKSKFRRALELAKEEY